MAGPWCGHRAHGGPPARSSGPAPALPGRRRGRSPCVRPRLGQTPLRRGRRCPAIARADGTDVVVGLGGGSALDAAKAAAVAVGLEAGMREVIGVTLDPRAPVLPLVAVLTTAGSGSEVHEGVVRLRERVGLTASLRDWGVTEGDLDTLVAEVSGTLGNDPVNLRALYAEAL
ncbi:iron-containing alcohol dehydrogenase [Streptomyces canus]|uniref:iron-containing alcohol dehydrogenase n=1 Tax=Streptomyces canus TaxID=58343 RepID=UPI00368CDD5C